MTSTRCQSWKRRAVRKVSRCIIIDERDCGIRCMRGFGLVQQKDLRRSIVFPRSDRTSLWNVAALATSADSITERNNLTNRDDIRCVSPTSQFVRHYAAVSDPRLKLIRCSSVLQLERAFSMPA